MQGPYYSNQGTVSQQAAQPTAKQARKDFGGQVGETLAVSLALALAAGLWYVGAYFTLVALESIGIPVSQLSTAQWLVPVAISALEMWWWPKNIATEGKVIAFAITAFIDGGSTMYGLIQWAGGRFIPLGTGVTIPEDGPYLIVFAMIGALILTFVPERALWWGKGELKRIWKG